MVTMNKVNNLYIITLSIVFLLQLKTNASIGGFKLFKKTHAWELAKAVRSQNIRKITYLIKTKGIDPNSKDSIEESSLLYYAMIHRKYRSMKALMENGADPNARNICNMTPLTCLSNYWWHGLVNQKKAATILLQYGADINAKCEFHRPKEMENAPYDLLCVTALSSACMAESMNYIKFLIKNGADPSIWVCDSGSCALTDALIQDRMNVVKYLVVDLKTKIPPYGIVAVNNDTLSILRMLRNRYYRLGSRKHVLKMEIVDFIKKNYGLDYFKEPIPQFVLKRIREEHGKDFEEYIQKY